MDTALRFSPMLDCPRVVPVVGEFVAGRMAQHVRMDRKLDAGLPSGASYDLSHRIRGQWRFAFAYENICAIGVLALQTPQSA